MNKRLSLTPAIIATIVVALSQSSCIYDATIHSKFTYAVPSQEQHDDQQQRQHRHAQQQQRLNAQQAFTP